MGILQWYADEVLLSVSNATRNSLRSSGVLVAKKARNNCPVGEVIKSPKKGGPQWTGRVPGTLKKSIRYRMSRKKLTVQVIAGSRSKLLTAYYAMWVEFGTKNMMARPFLRPALESSGSEILETFMGAMK